MEVFHTICNESLTKVMLSIILIIVSYLYGSYKLNYWKRKGVKQLSKSNIIFGNLCTSRKSTFENIYGADSDSPYIGFYFFHKPCLLLKDTEIIKQMLIRDFHNFPNRNFAGERQRDSLGMTTLFAINNPAWKYLRQKFTPALTKRKLKQMLPLMTDCANSMMSYLNNQVKNCGPKCVDVEDLNHKYGTDLMANIALGIKTDSFQYPESDYTKIVKSYFCSFKRMFALVTLFFVPELVANFGSMIFFNASFVRKLFYYSIGFREKHGIKRGDFIDSIIELKNGPQNSLYPFEGDNLLFQSLTFFPGFETSTNASLFGLMELAKHKEYQDRARQDVKNALSKHGWTIEAFDEMKYLNQCITETIRLHPPVSIDRHTLRDYNIPNTNIWIDRGTPIFIYINGLHRDKRYFDEPEIFNPERFGTDRMISDAYVPFGVGQRKCIGVRLGLLHLKIVIAMILSEYEIYQQPGEENNGFNVQFTKLVHQ